MSIVLPSLSAGMESGIIARWLKSEGDEVVAGEAIAEVETDKAIVELTAEAPGRIAKILVEPGGSANVHQIIATLQSDGSPLLAGLSNRETATIEPPDSRPIPPARIFASPLARRIAMQSGIDLSSLTGSGPGGRVVRIDVQAAGGELGKAVDPEPADLTPAKKDAGSLASGASGTTSRPATGSLRMVHFEVEIEIDALLSLLAGLNAAGMPEQQIPFIGLVVRACALALANLSTSLAEGDAIGVLAKTSAGMRTATVHGAEAKSVGALSFEIGRLLDRGQDTIPAAGRDCRIVVHLTEAAGIALSTSGFDGAAVLSVGGRKRCPVARGDDIVLAEVVKCRLSIDQATNDAFDGAELLDAFRDTMEKPLRLFV